LPPGSLTGRVVNVHALIAAGWVSRSIAVATARKA
jgi:hypothetical protein